MGLFQKQEKLKYVGLAFLKELTNFKTHRLKMLEFKMKWGKGGKWSGCLYLKLNKKFVCKVYWAISNVTHPVSWIQLLRLL